MSPTVGCSRGDRPSNLQPRAQRMPARTLPTPNTTDLAAANTCPPRQYCESTYYIYGCEEDECDEEYQISRCRCWEFFGHGGDTCEETSANSYIVAAFFTIGGIIGLLSFYFHLITAIPVVGKLVKSELKMNIATTTLFMSTAGVVFANMITWAYVTSALLIDSELTWERSYIGPMFGVLAMFVCPAVLLVCTMWIDVASAGMKRTKAQRAAAQKKVRCTMITCSVIVSFGMAALAVLDMRQAVSYLTVLVFIVVGILYAYGGLKLSNMLASEGKSAPSGLFGTCKTGTTPGMIVVNTAVNIAICCFMNIMGGVIYAVAGNPISALGVTILITTVSVVLLIIVLYLRFGLRKVLNLQFDIEKGNDTATTTSSETPRTAKVAPANCTN
mmetsp:Transcript_9195/g.22964  ORF Transcript_9195/g.22964 Transcript_9195/m.22964 type:complete len:387 (+) Transcript_9195:242-1402(+)